MGFAVSGSEALRIPSSSISVVDSRASALSSSNCWPPSHAPAATNENSPLTCKCNLWCRLHPSECQFGRGTDESSLRNPIKIYHWMKKKRDWKNFLSHISIVKFRHLRNFFNLNLPPVRDDEEIKLHNAGDDLLIFVTFWLCLLSALDLSDGWDWRSMDTPGSEVSYTHWDGWWSG